MRSRALKSQDRALEVCAHCKTPRAEHEARERAGALHHKFDATGARFEVVEAPDEANARKGQRSSGLIPRVVGDPVVRFLLIQKGLITAQELTAAEETLRATGTLKT